MPTDRELEQLVNGPELPSLLQLWAKPIDPVLPMLRDTVDKPVGQLSVKEAIAWGLVIAYVGMSVLLAEELAFGLLRVAAIARR